MTYTLAHDFTRRNQRKILYRSSSSRVQYPPVIKESPCRMEFSPSSITTKSLLYWFLVVFLCIPTSCSQALVDVSSQPVFETLYTVQRRVLNKIHVIATFHSVTQHSLCMMKCESRIDCYSVNFYPGKEVCELNNATHLSHPDGFEEDPVGTFLTNVFSSIGWCSDILCTGTGKRCFLNPDQLSFQCLDYCTGALGLEDRRIPDSSLTASSSIPVSQPTACRLKNTDEWGAGTNEIGQYLQVDLNGVFKLTGIATQGHTQKEYWVTKYKVAYRTSEAREFHFYEENGVVKLFDANVDKSSVVTNSFTIGFVARYVRIVIQSWNSWTAMRAELYGCSLN